MRRFLLIAAAACLLAAAQEPRWVVLNREAREAAAARDYARLRSTLLELKPLMPGNPRVTYVLAAAEARLGNSEAALERLRNFAGMGLLYDLAGDADFTALRGTPDFAAILGRIDESRDPENLARPAFALPADLIPEDIAYDSAARRFFVSSVRKGVILVEGTKEFAASDWPVLALAVDQRRHLLWAATGWMPHCERCNPSDADKTALLAFDLASGKLKQRLESPVKGLLGDMTIGRRGDLYVSENKYGALFHVPAGGGEFQRLDAPGEFPAPQTPALSADEKTLYVPDYLRGIAAVDLATRAVRWIEPADDIALSGIDGLYLYGDGFLAVQNGVVPRRIVRFPLDLRHQQVLEANTPALGEPTHGTLVGDTFYFIANSGWNAYDERGQKRPGIGPIESAVLKIVLPKKTSPSPNDRSQ